MNSQLLSERITGLGRHVCPFVFFFFTILHISIDIWSRVENVEALFEQESQLFSQVCIFFLDKM